MPPGILSGGGRRWVPIVVMDKAIEYAVPQGYLYLDLSAAIARMGRPQDNERNRPSVFSTENDLAEYLHGSDVKAVYFSGYVAYAGNNEHQTPLSTSKQETAFSPEPTINRYCQVCRRPHNSRMSGCFGSLELQGDTVELNNDFLRGRIPLFFFGDTRGQAMLPLLGCSICDFKEVADNQLSRFLTDQVYFIQDAVKDCPEFAKVPPT